MRKIFSKCLYDLSKQRPSRKTLQIFPILFLCFVLPSVCRYVRIRESPGREKRVHETHIQDIFIEVPKTFNDAQRLDFYLKNVASQNEPIVKTNQRIATKTIISETPVVSIITPAHNPDIGQLNELYTAIVRQTVINWEWIIINDASDRNSSMEMEKLALQDSRIRYLATVDVKKEALKNVGKARNYGINNANSDLVFFIDSDDLVAPTGIEKMIHYLNIYPAAHFVNSYILGFGAFSYKWAKGFNPSNIFATENPVIPTSLHRKSSLNKIGGYSNRSNGLEDWDTWLKYAENGMWGGTIPEYLTLYRRRNNHSDRWKDLDARAIQIFKEQIAVKHPRLSHQEYWPENPEKKQTRSLEHSEKQFRVKTNSVTSLPKKHLLLIVPWLELGGSDRFNLVLLQGLRKKGWTITILTTLKSENTWLKFFREVTEDIFFLPSFDTHKHLEYVQMFGKARDFDVILISNSFNGYIMIPFIRRVFPNCVLADYIHMEEPHWRKGGHARHGLAHQSQVDVTFVASNHLKNWMIRNGADDSKLEVAYVGVELDKWRPDWKRKLRIRSVFGFEPHDTVVLYNCRLVDQKQPLVMAETVISVLKKLDDVGKPLCHFVILGSGPLLFDIKKIFNTLPEAMKNFVHIFHSVPYSAINDFTSLADIAFLPSQHEGIPTVFFEAMALGNVVVGADVGGISELVVHNTTGVLVKPKVDYSNEPKSLIWGTEDFIAEVNNYSNALFSVVSDKNRRERMKFESMRRIRDFSTKDTIAQLEKCFRDKMVLKQRKDSGEQLPSVYQSYKESYDLENLLAN